MAIQTIDLGSIPLDGTDGDNARQAFTKVNANFSDLDVRKVEVVAGKQLSTNDYTNADKSIVDNFQSNLNGRQPLNSKLTAIAESVWAVNRLMYMTGAGTVGFTDFPAQARTFLSAATQVAQRTALGLGSVATDNVVPIERGGTGATTQGAAQIALSLVPTVGALDFTTNRLASVGFAGWGGTAPSTPGLVSEQLSSLLYDTSTTIFPVTTPIVNVRGSRSMAWAARSSRSWVYTYGETPVLMEHWTDKNLVKQTSIDDATPGSVLLNGAHGLGEAAIPKTSIAETEADQPTSFFRNPGTTTNPYPAPCAGMHVRYGSGYAVQFTGSIISQRYFARSRFASGSWSSVAEFWHTGNLTPNKLEDRTQATLGAANSQKGQMYLCTNTTSRGQRPVYSDGTNWRRIEDESLITAA